MNDVDYKSMRRIKTELFNAKAVIKSLTKKNKRLQGVINGDTPVYRIDEAKYQVLSPETVHEILDSGVLVRIGGET